MQQKNLQTKMIKDEYKQHITDETKLVDFGFHIAQVLVILWFLMMVGATGYFIYLLLT